MIMFVIVALFSSTSMNSVYNANSEKWIPARSNKNKVYVARCKMKHEACSLHFTRVTYVKRIVETI